MKFNVRADILATLLRSGVEASTKSIIKNSSDIGKMTLDSQKQCLKINAFGGHVGVVLKFDNINFDYLDYDCETPGKVTIGSTDLVLALGSFEPGVVITIQLNEDGSTKELIIVNKNDDSEKQCMPVFDNEVNMPKIASTFDKNIKIRRDVFINSVNRVFFAVGFGELIPKFLYWILKTDKEKATFATGTGMRFMLLKLSGKDFIEVDGPQNVMIHKDFTPLLISILNTGYSEFITIKQSSKNSISSNQTVIEYGTHIVVLVGFDSDMDWVDEDMIINSDKMCKFITKTSDWVYPMKGIRATYSAENRKESIRHNMIGVLDKEAKQIEMETNELTKSKRKVSIGDFVDNGEDLYPFTFKCSSQYLSELPHYFDTGGFSQIEIMGPRKPIIVRDYASEKVSDKVERINDKTGLTEEYIMFFSVLLTEEEDEEED